MLGKTDPNHPDKYKQQSIIIVPSNTPGIEIKRMLSVYGYDDAPHGHAHLVFKDVRVPVENIVLGEGRGFEVMQGRMGPGRIHHAMRSIGAVSLQANASVCVVVLTPPGRRSSPLAAHTRERTTQEALRQTTLRTRRHPPVDRQVPDRNRCSAPHRLECSGCNRRRRR